MRTESRRVAEWIRRNGGAVPLRQLDGAGLGRVDISTAVAEGAVIRIRRGWYAVPDAPADVARAARVGGAATAASIARLHGLWQHDGHDDGMLHVRVPLSASKLYSPDPLNVGVRLDRERERVCLHYRSGPIVSARDPLALALAEMLRCAAPDDAVAAIDSALARGELGPTGLDRLRELTAPSYRRTLDRCSAGSESGIETKVRLLLRRHRIAHRTQVRISPVGWVDLLVGDRFVIEADGSRFHAGEAEFENDRRRDFELAMRGYVVLRLSYRMITDDWPVVREGILAIIARGEHRWGYRAAGSTGLSTPLKRLDRHDDAPPAALFGGR